MRLRRILLAAGVLVAGAGVAVGAPRPAAAYGWQSHWLVGNAWDYFHVHPGASPQACVGLGSVGNHTAAKSYIEFQRSDGLIIGRLQDSVADGRNVCAWIPRDTYRARAGLLATGGPDGLSYGFGYSIGGATSGHATYLPWYGYNVDGKGRVDGSLGTIFPTIPAKSSVGPGRCTAVGWFANPIAAQAQVTSGVCDYIELQVMSTGGVWGLPQRLSRPAPFHVPITAWAAPGTIACHFKLTVVDLGTGLKTSILQQIDGWRPT